MDKHPQFAHLFASETTLEDAIKMLPECRALLREESEQGKRQATTVFMCEVFEMLEAYKDGDLDKAIEELLDHTAVAVRMFGYLKKLKRDRVKK